MKGGAAAARVGATVLITLFLAFVGFRFVAKGIHGSAGYRVWALFHDATGLVDKSRVQIAGLNIGEIAARSLEGSAAKVTLRIGPDVVLWSNATVFKKTASLLGEFYLEIDPGTEEAPDPLTGKIVKNDQLKDGDQIKNVVEAVTTTDVLVQVNETLPVLRDILKDVRKVTQGPLQDIASSVKTGVDRNSEAAERLLNHVEYCKSENAGLITRDSGFDLCSALRDALRCDWRTEGALLPAPRSTEFVAGTAESTVRDLSR